MLPCPGPHIDPSCTRGAGRVSGNGRSSASALAASALRFLSGKRKAHRQADRARNNQNLECLHDGPFNLRKSPAILHRRKSAIHSALCDSAVLRNVMPLMSLKLCLRRTPIRRSRSQAGMRSCTIVVFRPRFEHASDVRLVERNDEIRTFAVCGPYQSLTIVLPLFTDPDMIAGH